MMNEQNDSSTGAAGRVHVPEPPSPAGPSPAVAGPPDGAGSQHVEAELATRLRLAVGRLARRLRREGGEGLSPSLLSALVTIDVHGPLTLGALAAHEAVTPPSVTRLVAELERQGLVRRERHPDDRRAARLSLTADGRRALARVRSRKTAYLARRLSELDKVDLAALQAALPVLERLLKDER